MAWKPPTEEEFNHEWITPLDALDVSDIRMADDADIWALIEQLRAGQINSVARTAQAGSVISGVERFVPVLPSHWRRLRGNEEDLFWKKGHVIVPVLNSIGQPSGHFERFFDVRFDPASFTGQPPPLPDEATEEELAALTVVEEPPAERPTVKRADLERWHEVFKVVHPEAREGFALKSAAAMFPDHRVPRQWVRDLRGPQPLGKPKTRHD